MIVLAFVCGDVMLGCDIEPPQPFHVGDKVHVLDGDKLRLACSSWPNWDRPRPAPRWEYTVMFILSDWWGKPLVFCSSPDVIADPAVAESAVVFFRRLGLIKIGKYDHASEGKTCPAVGTSGTGIRRKHCGASDSAGQSALTASLAAERPADSRPPFSRSTPSPFGRYSP